MICSRLTLLGGFRAYRRDGSEVVLPSRKVEALLAILACRPGERLPRERLTVLLWGDRADRQARHSLSQSLCSIRRAFGDTAELLATSRDAIALHPHAVEVDVAELQRLSASDFPDDLRAAADLYRGPLLDGSRLCEPAFEEWLAQERMRLHELAVTTLTRLADRQATLGDEAAATATLNRAVALDSLAEEAHRRLMRLHLDRGSYNAAVRRYRHCADALRRELGTLPEPSTTSLYREALGGLETGSAPAVDTAAPEIEDGKPAAASATASAPLPVDQDGTIGAAPHRASIVVMPFLDPIGGDGGCGGLGQGLAHDVIAGLARLRNLFVIAQGTAFALGERRIGREEVGRILNVDYVVSGSVQHSRSRITVTIQLAETGTGRIVWADAFTHPLDDALLVLGEIGSRIVASIDSEIELAERNRAILKPPGSLNAWQAYHRGLWHLYRFTASDNEQAHHLFGMAARLDPTFARAFAGLSFAHFQNALMRRASEPRREVDLAFETAGQSLAADDRDPAARLAMGRALWLRGCVDQSLVELEKAVELSPSFALGHYSLGFVNCQSGDPDAAIASSDRARHLSPYDPLLFAMLANRAMALIRLGHFQEAADWAVRAAAQPNAHTHTLGIAASCLGAAGRLSEARAHVALIHDTLPHYGIDDFLASFRFHPDSAELFRRGAQRIGLG